MTKSAKGIAQPELEAPELGILIPGTTSVALAGRKVWRYGLARTADQKQHAVFVCLCDWRELIVQSLVTSIGRAIGLPVPACYIIATNQQAFPETGSDKTVFLFGCRANPHPTLSMFAERMDEAADLLLTIRKDITNRLIILDEWSGNARRGDTAMLIDPSSGLLFVDHHPALQDGHGPADQLANWVHEITHGAAQELEQVRLRKEIEKSACNIFKIPLQNMADQHLFWLEKPQDAVWYELLDYLSARRHQLESLFCNRLGIAEQQLQFAP